MRTFDPDALTSVVCELTSLYVLADDPAALCERLSKVLQLPIRWPLTDHGAFAAAAFSLGTCTLSIQRWSWLDPQPTPPLRVGGLLFSPAQPIAAAARELDLRAIPHTPPLQMTLPSSETQAGSRQISVDVHGVVGNGIEVVLLEREGDRPPSAPAVAVAREVVLNTPRVEDARKAWERLLSPPRALGDRWTLGHGPTLRLVSSDRPESVAIVLAVPSLAAAEAHLDTCDVAWTRDDRLLTIDPAALLGLEVQLVEAE
jgi:hypothetical protein